MSEPQKKQKAIMQDFVFGGIEHDESRLLAAERERYASLRHHCDIHPRNPQPNESVKITVYAGPDIFIDHVSAYVTINQSGKVATDPQGHRGVCENGMVISLEKVDTRWESLLWDYVDVWQGEIPAQPDNTLVQYRIEGWSSYDTAVSVWSAELNIDRTPPQPTLYGYHVDQVMPPQWAREGVLYHIFVDRFEGAGLQPYQGDWLPKEQMNEFVGGTLQGVIDRLDYVASLGVSAIWLSPVFVAGSYHGYDTYDYYNVDPRFGTNADLKRLVEAAHQHGLRVILDLVVNHCGLDFPPFAAALDAHQKNEQSDYLDWFSFDPIYTHGYRTFFNVAKMPQLNLDNPGARQYMINVAHHWMTEYDVDGFRLDYAAGPSHVFWSAFYGACKAIKSDCWVFGEVTRTGDTLRAYTGRLDGCLDFSFGRSIRLLFSEAITLAEFASTIVRSHEFFHPNHSQAFIHPSFLDNHDMNRILWVLQNDKQQFRLAVGLMFALGGPPIIYYGTEVGLSQPRSKAPWLEEARHLMLWGDDQDTTLLAEFRQWIALRRAHPALSTGRFVTHRLDNEQGIWVFERVNDDDRVLVVVNASESAQTVTLPDDTSESYTVDALSVSVKSK
ncbi:MAG: alpha-amylase family glycosyl hydrolase [Chloroflexota bacterium]